MADTAIAVLATLDSKAAEARFACRTLIEAGAMPVLIDMSLRPHNVEGAAVSGGLMAEAGGTSWPAMAKLDRAQAPKRWLAAASGSSTTDIETARSPASSPSVVPTVPRWPAT